MKSLGWKGDSKYRKTNLYKTIGIILMLKIIFELNNLMYPYPCNLSDLTKYQLFASKP